ncbi:MAG TPA: YjgN family protein [Xanthomonadaceae bacterium]|nr:YjgN family protein [Xanthomonadaceae bacterium]
MLDHVPASPAGEFSAPADLPQVQRHRPQFTGSAGEYFGIWFVNLLLGIVTLGIYSAWAKVRTQRYFYANTRLAGSSFDYLASPIAILKGRLIAYAVLIALGVSARFAPGVYLALILAVGLMMPALIVWSLRFRARNSAWRGISFRFDQPAGEAYGPFLLWGWLTGLTATILYPVMKKRQQEFVVEGHRYGHKRFDFSGEVGAYYAPYGVAVLFGIGLMVGFTILLGTLANGAGNDKAAVMRAAYTSVGLLYLGMFLLVGYLRVRYANLMWGNSRLGRHRFESTLRVRDMLWIYASNAVAIVCTLGLAVPWAMVRLARYRAEHFALVAAGDLDEFVAASESRAGATGAELVDALDTGFDFGW